MKGWLPAMVYYAALVIIGLLGFYYIWITILSIISRDRMNYQEYDWFFNSKNAPTDKIQGEISVPWEKIDVTTCVGPQCCLPGYKYDSDLNKCTLLEEGFNTMNTIDEEEFEAFTRHAYTTKKPDIVMDSNVMPTYSSTNLSTQGY